MPLRSRADSRARRCLSSSSAIAVMKTVWIAQVFRQAPHTINSAKIPANAWLHWQGCLLFLRSLRLFAAKSLDQFHQSPLPCLYPDRIRVICSSAAQRAPTSSPLRGTIYDRTIYALPRFVWLKKQTSPPCAPQSVSGSYLCNLFLCRPKGTRHHHPFGARSTIAPSTRSRAPCG